MRGGEVPAGLGEGGDEGAAPGGEDGVGSGGVSGGAWGHVQGDEAEEGVGGFGDVADGGDEAGVVGFDDGAGDHAAGEEVVNGVGAVVGGAHVVVVWSRKVGKEVTFNWYAMPSFFSSFMQGSRSA